MARERRILLSAALIAVTLACAPAPPPPPAPPPEPPPPPPFPHAVVWTARPGVRLVTTDSAHVEIPALFTRLEVLEPDSAALTVRCHGCAGGATGRVELADVVYEVVSPQEAAGRELAEFALAVRQAAARRDVLGLRSVMARDFTYSFGGGGGPAEALAAWERQGYQPLDRLVAVLDRGLTTREGELWAAPPEHFAQLEYLDYRAGFRRSGGRWEWIFFVRGD